jgi:membrane protease subunit HflK
MSCGNAPSLPFWLASRAPTLHPSAFRLHPRAHPVAAGDEQQRRERRDQHPLVHDRLRRRTTRALLEPSSEGGCESAVKPASKACEGRESQLTSALFPESGYPAGATFRWRDARRDLGMNTPKEWLEKHMGGKGWHERARPGGGGSGRGAGGGVDMPSREQFRLIGIVAIVLVTAWALFSMFYTVQPEERAVVKRFGKVIGITDPGLHFKLPFGIDNVRMVATERVLKQEFGFRTELVSRDQGTRYSEEDHPEESLMLSGDLNMIDVEWVVQYRISDPIKYLYAMREPERTLHDISESVLRRVVGNRIGSEVLTTGRVEISTTARDEIQSAMQNYDNGVHVITVELQDVVPPARVQPAFNEVNEARQERERMINEATKEANQAIPRAEGEANRQIAQAEGYATERVNRARGETARFSAVLGEYRTAPEVTRTRMYLEALHRALPKVGSVLVVQDGQVPPVPLLNLRNAHTAAAAPAAAASTSPSAAKKEGK